MLQASPAYYAMSHSWGCGRSTVSWSLSLCIDGGTGAWQHQRWLADLRVTAAAIAHQKPEHVLHASKIRAIDDRAALPTRRNPTRTRQHRKMCRHGVVRHRQLAGDFTRRKPLWLMAYEQPECLQACFLGERGETVNGTFYFHASKHIDILKPRQRIAAQRRLPPRAGTEKSRSNCPSPPSSNRPAVMSV